MSLKPGSQIEEAPSDMKALSNSLDTRRSQSRPGLLQLTYIRDQLEAKDAKEPSGHAEDDGNLMPVSNGEDLTLCSPPKTENEVLKGFVVINYILVCSHCSLAHKGEI